MAVIWMFAPPVIDDFWYRNEYKELLNDTGNGLQACLQALNSRVTTDNIRLPNLIFVFLQPFDYRVLTGIFTALCWAVSFVSAIKIAGCTLRRADVVVAITLLWLLGLPWDEYMMSAAFYLNYVVPCAFMFCTIWMFLSGKHSTTLAVIFAALTSWAHEAAGLTLIAALVGRMIFDHRIITRRRVFIMAAAIVVFCFHLIAPAYKVHSAEYAMGSRNITVDVFFAYPSVWLFICVTFVLIAAKKFGYCKSISSGLLAMFSAAGMVSIFLHCLFQSFDRCAWFGLAMVYTGYAYLLTKVKVPVMIQRLTGIVTFALLCWHFTAVGIEVFKVRRLFFPALEAYEKNDCRPVFVDVLAEKDILEASLGRGSRLPFQPGVSASNISGYFDHGQLRSMVFIPRQLNDVSVNPGTKVPGENEYYIKDGYLYRPSRYADADVFRIETAEVSRGNLTRRERLIIGYFTDSEGYGWEYAASTARLHCTKPITAIKEIE